jgi:hypothetical protein
MFWFVTGMIEQGGIQRSLELTFGFRSGRLHVPTTSNMFANWFAKNDAWMYADVRCSRQCRI